MGRTNVPLQSVGSKMTGLTLLLTLLVVVESLLVYQFTNYRDTQVTWMLGNVHSLRHLELDAKSAYIDFLKFESASNVWAGVGPSDHSLQVQSVHEALQAKALVNEQLATLQSKYLDTQELKQVAKLSNDIKVYESYFQQAAAISQGNRSSVQNILYVQNSAAMSRVESDFQSLFQSMENQINTNEQASLLYTTRSAFKLFAVLVTSILLSVGLIRFILRLRKIEKSAMEGQEIYKFLVDHITDLVSVIGPDGTIEYASPSHASVGYDPTSLRGRRARDFVHPDDHKRVSSALEGTQARAVQFRVLDAHGKYFAAEAYIQGPNRSNSRDRTVLIGRDATQQQALKNIQDHAQGYDALTGLPRRREWITESLELQRTEQVRSAVVLVQLNGFRTILRAYGQLVVDGITKSVAARLTAEVGERGVVARLADQLFGITVSGHQDVVIESLLTDILRRVQSPILVGQNEMSIHATLGGACDVESGDGIHSLIEEAEIALDHALTTAQNFAIYGKDVGVQSIRRVELSTKLNTAITRNELFLVYQPRVDVKSRNVAGVEALVRWENPELGMVSPGEFIPIAELYGQIDSIGEWVLRTACSQQVAWTRAGYPPVRLSINISGRQLFDPNFAKVLKDILNETGADPQWIELELTESIMANNPDTLAVLFRLKEIGLRVSIDDFGTGYSSLSYLQNYPFDVLKIDQSYVQRLGASKSSTAIVKSIVDLAHSLNALAVAEGVETKEQFELLESFGCDEIQGYLINKPIPVETFVANYLGTHTIVV